jgi:hypothetical protein
MEEYVSIIFIHSIVSKFASVAVSGSVMITASVGVFAAVTFGAFLPFILDCDTI